LQVSMEKFGYVRTIFIQILGWEGTRDYLL
jgi:hypothetical protein